METCPLCASEIPAEAQVCRWCGWVRPDSQWGRTRQQMYDANTWLICIAVGLVGLIAVAWFTASTFG